MNYYQLQITINHKDYWIEMDFDKKEFKCKEADFIYVVKKLDERNIRESWEVIFNYMKPEYEKWLNNMPDEDYEKLKNGDIVSLPKF